MRLYEIAEGYRALDAALDESGGEITEEIAARIDRLDSSLEDKVDAIGTLIRESEVAAVGYTGESERMRGRATAAKNKANRLREHLRRTLVAVGRDKVKGRLFSARPAKASRPSISCDGPHIPTRFARTVVELDGAKAYEAFKAGILPDGFSVRFTEYLDLR